MVSHLRRMSLSKRNFLFIALALSALSLYELVETGGIRWPRAVYGELVSYLGRPAAGWRKATDTLNDVVPGVPRKFDIEGRVVRVADGDTISVLDQRRQQYKIRFYGIDAPELGQPYGNAARKALVAMLDGAHVRLVVVDVDDYKRQVATVYVGDSNVNTAMVARGYAWWYRYHARHREDLRQAESEAREARAGLWADPNPEPPWEWRRRNR